MIEILRQFKSRILQRRLGTEERKSGRRFDCVKRKETERGHDLNRGTTIRSLALFVLLTLFVGLASAFDLYLNVKFPIHAAVEENPLARWILQANGDDNHARALLLGLKFGGTLVVSHVLWVFYFLPRTRRWAWLAAWTLIVIQLAVLLYMTDNFTFF